MELSGTTMEELADALDVLENSIETGDSARLKMITAALPLAQDLETMWAEMTVAGFHVSKPTATLVNGVPTTSMVMTKGSPVLVALIPFLVPLAITGLVAFGITQVQTISKALLPLLLATGGVLIIALGIMRQPAARAAELAAGKYLR